MGEPPELTSVLVLCVPPFRTTQARKRGDRTQGQPHGTLPLDAAAKLRGEDRVQALLLWKRKGKQAFEAET